MSTFLDLLKKREDIDTELIIGDCDMPASFVWNDDMFFTEYAIGKYGAILNAEYRMIGNGNIEIFCDDYNLGERFVYAVAGYVSETEYDKLIGIYEEGSEE